MEGIPRRPWKDGCPQRAVRKDHNKALRETRNQDRGLLGGRVRDEQHPILHARFQRHGPQGEGLERLHQGSGVDKGEAGDRGEGRWIACREGG